jgi:hypothetical protein
LLPAEISEKYSNNLNIFSQNSNNNIHTSYKKKNGNNFSNTNNSFNYYVQKRVRKEYPYTKDSIKKIIYNCSKIVCHKEPLK